MPTQFLQKFADEAQTVLAALLEQSRDCIKLIGIAGDVEYMNQNGLQAMEICDQGSVLGARWIDFWPADQAPAVAAALDRAKAGQSSRFEAFCPTLQGTPRWWHVAVSPVRDARQRITHVLAVSRDITDLVRDRAETERRLSEAEDAAAFEQAKAGELRHRMKNLLTVVASLVKHQARSAASASDLAQRLDERLRALGRAQDLIAQRTAESGGLQGEIVRLLDDMGAVEVIGIDCDVAEPMSHQAIEVLALILSELQTNAMKHGALASSRGRVTLRVSMADEDHIALDWEEHCPSPMAPQQDGGNGLVLLRRLGSAAGPARFDWAETGLKARLTVRT